MSASAAFAPLGPLVTAALAGGSRLLLARNRCGTYTADLLPAAPGAATEIGATMPTPAAALAQLERALAAEYASPPAGARRRPTPGYYHFAVA